MGLLQKRATRATVVALTAGGLALGSAGVAHADASAEGHWGKPVEIHVNEFLPSLGKGKYELPDKPILIYPGEMTFGVRGRAGYVESVATSWASTDDLSVWSVVYEFEYEDGTDFKTKDSGNHFTTAQMGRDRQWIGVNVFDLIPPERQNEAIYVCAQLYAHGRPIPGARVRHKIGRVPGMHNRVYDAGVVVGKGLNKAEDVTGDAVREAADGAKWVGKKLSGWLR